ncbi:MAG: hypothetical protein M3Y42_09470 [Actinomycetota bacterium]|nr:hypothetical protein [Actinomycetota bacterium]MDQ2957179.1 hypothetical protein [Actinomycetota bacterium]
MAILTAVGILLSVLIALDLLLTVGILRRLRNGADGVPTKPTAVPVQGHRIDLSLDGLPWPDGAAAALAGTALVAMVVPGCSTCERLHRAIDELDYGVPIPFIALGQTEPEDAAVTAGYLASWQGATPIVAPRAFDELDSFGRPDRYPVIMVVENGRVAASGYRLHEVTAAMYRAADSLHAATHQH